MNKHLLAFFVVLCSLFQTSIVAAAPNASILLSNPFVTNNITHTITTNAGDEPYTVQTTIGRLDCRQIPGSKYGYFDVTDATVGSAQPNLIFTVQYYDKGTDDIAFQYNATGAVNYKGMTIKKTNTNAWITATIALTDASLRNAQNNGADFRIGTTTGYDNYIREITVTIGSLNPATEPLVPTTASAYSEFIGKSVAGYQVWFNTGTPTSGWFHWAGNTQPAVGHLNFEVYPDVTEYAAADLAQTGFANLGNGTSSKLFNSSNSTVINKHFDWMQTTGIDGVALQRFINGIGSVINNSPAASPIKVKTAAEATNKIFYICYDISSSGLDATWDDIIMFDWVYNIEKAYGLTTSPAYAKVGNKPVVELWGTGFTGNHPGTEAETIALINFLKARGCYVIGGVPTYWRTENNDSKSDFLDAYNAYDMISPWSVGRFGDIAGANNFKTNLLIPDKAHADGIGKAYMPVIFPGFSWSQWNSGAPNAIPRKTGEFSWTQALNIKSIGVSNMYFAMFDEYDEGTAIMKAATDYTMLPTDQYFVTTSADGIWTSSDFYLRLAAAETELIKGTRSVTPTVPIAYSLGPIYYRNGFEKRFANYDATSGYFNIDPCFYNDAVVSNSNVTAQSLAIENNVPYSKTGSYTTKITGSANAANANYYYKVSTTKITVKANMQLSFWKYSFNTLGQNTTVDLVFQSGNRLSALPAYVDNNGATMTPAIARGTVGAWEKFTCQIGTGALVGDVITGIIIGYNNTSATGTFTAYFDDIVIEDAVVVTQSPFGGIPWPIPGKIEAEAFDNGGEGIAYHDDEATNKFNQYRLSEGVDAETTNDQGLGGYDLGWTVAGEWLEYTVDVQTAATYTLQARMASGNAGTRTIRVYMDNVDISGAISFDASLAPYSLGWQTFHTISITTPVLTAGTKIMKIAIEAGDFNLNYVNFNVSVPMGIDWQNNNNSASAKNKANIAVYPMPVKAGGTVNIEFQEEEVTNYYVRLFNALGQVIYSEKINAVFGNASYQLPLEQNMPPGHYQLEVIGDNGLFAFKKIVVQ